MLLNGSVSFVCKNSIVTDIIQSKLETAKLMGATVVINGTQENLKEAGV